MSRPASLDGSAHLPVPFNPDFPPSRSFSAYAFQQGVSLLGSVADVRRIEPGHVDRQIAGEGHVSDIWRNTERWNLEDW